MRQRPKILNLMILGLLGIMVSMPVQVMLVYEHGLSEWPLVLAKLSILNLVFMVTCGAYIYTLYRASQWMIVLAPAVMGVVAWNNWIVGTMATDFSVWQTSMATAGFWLFNGLLMHPQVRELIKQPEKRWWLRPKRYHLEVPILISPHIGSVIYRVVTYDLSETGAFLPFAPSTTATDEGFCTGCPDHLKAGEHMSLTMKIGTLRKIRCDAVVIRNSPAIGEYPAGVGIQFRNMNAQDKKELQLYLDSQPKSKLFPPTNKVALSG